MIVQVTLVIEVDPQAWELTYGVGGEDVRADVAGCVHQLVCNSAASEERCITGVTMC